MQGIVVEGLNKPVFGTIVTLSHDNLAANLLCGMVESFQANYCCRLCLAHKSEIQTKLSDEDVSLRTALTFQNSTNFVDENNFGFKRWSLLNDLNYFKLGDSLSVDVMHDILEGCVPLELKLF